MVQKTKPRGLAAHLLQLVPEGAHGIMVALSSKELEARGVRWEAVKLTPLSAGPPEALQGHNLFLCVSAFYPGPKGEVRRHKSLFAGQCGNMVDDVGTKIPLEVMDKIPLEPTWKVETSPGNFQYWYLYDDPITERAVAENLTQAIVERLVGDGPDPGMLGVTRVGRYGPSVNSKKKYMDERGRPWRVREERTGELVTVEQVVEAFGLDRARALSTTPQGRSSASGDATAASETDTGAALATDSLGVFLGQREKGDPGSVLEVRSGGWVDIVCPWVEEHTGGEQSGTAYLPPGVDGTAAGFKCHHGHCQDRGVLELRDWARAAGWDDPFKEPAATPEGLPEDARDDEQRMLEDWWYVGDIDAYVALPSLEVSGQAFNRLFPRTYAVLSEAGKKTPYAKASVWFVKEHPQRCVQRLGWDPRKEQVYHDEDGRTVLNTWRAPRVPAGSSPVPRLWLDHLKRLYPEDWRHVLLWMACTLQRPGVKINHALVLGGAPGIGKDTLLKPLAQLPGFAHDVDIHTVYGQFQDWLWRTKLVVLQEAKRGSRYDAADLNNTLKLYTADSASGHLTVNLKNRARVQVANVVNIAVVTNFPDALYLEAGDRRYYVAWSYLRDCDTEARTLNRWYEDGGLEEVQRYLLSLDLGEWDPKSPPPATEAAAEMRRAAMSPLARELDRVLPVDEDRQPVDVAMVTADLDGLRSDLKVTPDAVGRAMLELGWRPVRNPADKRGWWRYRVRGARVVRTYYAPGDLPLSEALEKVTHLFEETRKNAQEGDEDSSG